MIFHSERYLVQAISKKLVRLHLIIIKSSLFVSSYILSRNKNNHKPIHCENESITTPNIDA